jgi:hypothetical protein
MKKTNCNCAEEVTRKIWASRQVDLDTLEDACEAMYHTTAKVDDNSDSELNLAGFNKKKKKNKWIGKKNRGKKQNKQNVHSDDNSQGSQSDDDDGESCPHRGRTGHDPDGESCPHCGRTGHDPDACWMLKKTKKKPLVNMWERSLGNVCSSNP